MSADLLSDQRRHQPGFHAKACVSAATGGEALDLVLRFIEGSPEIRPLPAAAVVFQMLGIAWP